MTTILLPAIPDKKVTFADALDLLQQVVDECGPDYYYPLSVQAFYIKDGTPFCLIARALAKAGVSLEAMHSWDAVRICVSHILSPKYFTAGALAALSCAQECQDKGMTWGLCLERAKSIRVGPND